ncbi:MAG: hypothetical protein EOL95_10350 [Bacteroidia bacterium]|nr:hypothetical protein [Bacteroidia bacterium]
MNYYIKKDLTDLVRAKKCSNVFFAMREGSTVPALKKEGYMVEHASTDTEGLITREFVSVFEFESTYIQTDLSALDLNNIGDIAGSFLASDVARPTVLSTSPANNATDVAVDAAVTVTYSENVAVIAGKVAAIYAYNAETEVFDKVEDATSMSVTDEVLTIGHTAFANDAIIKVVIPADTIEDASANGNNYNTAYSFTFTVVSGE